MLRGSAEGESWNRDPSKLPNTILNAANTHASQETESTNPGNDATIHAALLTHTSTNVEPQRALKLGPIQPEELRHQRVPQIVVTNDGY